MNIRSRRHIKLVALFLMYCIAYTLALFGVLLLAVTPFNIPPAIATPLEWLGAILSTIGLATVSLSIYFEQHRRTPPSYISRKYLAPLMVALSLGFTGALFIYGALDPGYVLGLTAIALGGALFRLIGNPLEYGPDLIEGN